MSRMRRNRCFRSAALLGLTVLLVLWLASLTTAVARFGSHSELVLGNGRLTLVSTDHPSFNKSGSNPDSYFARARFSVIDRKKLLDGNYMSLFSTTTRKQSVPYWDIYVAESSYIMRTDFWQTRGFGFELPKLETHNHVLRVAGSWQKVRMQVVKIPLGAVIVSSVLLATLIFRKPRSFPPGHCQQCNYNLYKNASNTCPECGAVTEHVARLEKSQAV